MIIPKANRWSLLLLTSWVLSAWGIPGIVIASNGTDHDMNYRLDTVVEKPTTRVDSDSTADHAKFEELKGPFSNGKEVTQACLKCHTEAGHQFMQNIH